MRTIQDKFAEDTRMITGGKSFEYYKNLSIKEGFPLISLIVPTYNLEKYIPETIDSIKNQSINSEQYEVLFVDDCSMDNTREIISKKISDLKNATLIKTNSNGGAWATKNYGIRSSRGKYIMLLDGDDILEPNAIEETLNFLEKNPQVRYSYSQHRKIDSKGIPIYERKGFDFSREKLLNFNFVGAVECFDKELFEEIGGYRNIYVEDYDFALRASELLNEKEFKRNPIILYNHRLHNQNKTSGADKAREAAMNAIKESLKRKEGIDIEIKFKGYNEEKNTCFEWKRTG